MLKEKIVKLREEMGKGIYYYINKNKELQEEINQYASWTCNIIEKLYCIINDIIERPKCKYCKENNVTFKNINLGYMQYCSSTCTSRATREKAMNTIKENNNGLHHTQTEEWRKNNSSSFKNPEIQNKAQQNIDYKKRQEKKVEVLKEKYGVENVMHIEEVKNKVVEKLKIRTKEENIEKKKKSIQTMIEKYSDPIYNVKKAQESFRRNNWDIFVQKLKLKNIKPNFDIIEYMNCEDKDIYEFKCLECNKVFKFDTLRNGFEMRRINCKCQKKCKSSFEYEIIVWLKTLMPNIIIHSSYRFGNKLGDIECDIYLPDYNLGIEYNSFKYHSELYKDKTYHQHKTFYFKENGIEIIHIFEHLWRDKKELIKSILKNKLKLNKKIYARNCNINEISNKQYELFCIKNHIQGYCRAKIKIGLFNNNNLVGIISFSKPRSDKQYEYENIRTCFEKDTIVIGGVSKMFNYFIKIYNPKSIVSYCDISLFNGSSYFNIGYEMNYITIPNYIYFKNNDVKTRYQCQKHKLLNILENFDENKTELENMFNNGYLRIYDCGNFKFIWKSSGL